MAGTFCSCPHAPQRLAEVGELLLGLGQQHLQRADRLGGVVGQGAVPADAPWLEAVAGAVGEVVCSLGQTRPSEQEQLMLLLADLSLADEETG